MRERKKPKWPTRGSPSVARVDAALLDPAVAEQRGDARGGLARRERIVGERHDERVGAERVEARDHAGDALAVGVPSGRRRFHHGSGRRRADQSRATPAGRSSGNPKRRAGT